MSRPKPLEAPVMRIVLLVFFISFSSFLIRKILRFRFRFAFHAEGTSPGNERQRKVSRHKLFGASLDVASASPANPFPTVDSPRAYCGACNFMIFNIQHPHIVV